MNLRTPIAEETLVRGSTAESPAIQSIQRTSPNLEKSLKMLEALKEWSEADEKLTDVEMKRHREVLQSIDDNRLSDRKLFEQILAEPFIC